MDVTGFNINLTSAQPERLIAFYREIVGLQPNEQIGEGAFDVGGAQFLIDGHSETHGPNPQPYRMLINFFVADLEAEQARLEARGVDFIRSAGRESWGGVISTFVDPDGNYAQLIEFRPE